MLVHVVADSSVKLASVRAMLERKYDVTSELLGGLSVQHGDAQALVVKVDLRTIQNVCKLKKALVQAFREVALSR